MNGAVTTYQWCIELLNKRTGEMQDALYENLLSGFEDRLKLLKKGELCLVRTESADGEVKSMLWAYVEEKSRIDSKFQDAMGKDSGVEVPERFVVELQRFMNKERGTVRKKKEANLPVYNDVPSGRRMYDKSKPIVINTDYTEKIPVRINKKTIVYVDKNCSVQDIDNIIKKYTK